MEIWEGEEQRALERGVLLRRPARLLKFQGKDLWRVHLRLLVKEEWGEKERRKDGKREEEEEERERGE